MNTDKQNIIHVYSIVIMLRVLNYTIINTHVRVRVCIYLL